MYKEAVNFSAKEHIFKGNKYRIIWHGIASEENKYGITVSKSSLTPFHKDTQYWVQQ